MTTISQKIATFASKFDLNAASPNLKARVRTAFTDIIAVMLAGSRQQSAQILLDVVRAEQALPVVSPVGHDLKTSPQNAALLNGVATQALDLDLSFIRGSGQTTAPVIAALLPLAQAMDAKPQRLMSAFIVGAETSARLVKACPGLANRTSWHGTGIIGVISATTACCHLARKQSDVIQNAIGIATSMSAGIAVNFGTMTKPLHTGQAARNALLSLAIAERGFTAGKSSIEGKNGFYAAFAKDLERDDGVFDDLGDRSYLEELGFIIKPFGCGGILHCAIEATLNLRDKVIPHMNNINKIEIGLPPPALSRAITQYPWSEDSSRFSPVYLIPYTLIHGAPGFDAFTERGYGNDVVRSLSTKCHTLADRELSSLPDLSLSPARVTIELDDGTKFEDVVIAPPGSPENPIGKSRHKEKFISCSRQALATDQAEHLYAYLDNLGTEETLAGLWPLLTP